MNSATPSENPLKILVLCGGATSEREVSLHSGQAVHEGLLASGFEADLTDFQTPGDLLKQVKARQPDVVFNALHGKLGEDGCIQGLLELLGLPYTHSGVASSAMAMDKQLSRTILASCGLPVPVGKLLSPDGLLRDAPFTQPYVVKPLDEGSSVGVRLLQPDEDDRRQEIARTWSFGNRILAELFIPGLELTAAVLDGRPLTVTQIEPAREKEFYNFEAKYGINGSRHVLPAQIPEEIFQKALRLSALAHRALGCSGPSRTDFRYNPQNGELYILELNSQPGMTGTSLLPEQAKFIGLDFPALCSWIVLEALVRRQRLPGRYLPLWRKLSRHAAA